MGRSSKQQMSFILIIRVIESYLKFLSRRKCFQICVTESNSDCSMEDYWAQTQTGATKSRLETFSADRRDKTVIEVG